MTSNSAIARGRLFWALGDAFDGTDRLRTPDLGGIQLVELGSLPRFRPQAFYVGQSRKTRDQIMETILIYSLLTSAAFYLGSRAVITRWIWIRYPPPLARFFDCAACSGAWYGLIVSLILRLPLPGIPNEWWSHMVTAICSIAWTPIVAGLMQAGFERLGSAVPEGEDADRTNTPA